MDLVYDRLRRLAQQQHGRFQKAEAASLQPTELVHEAFLKLIKQRNRYDSRGHFFAIANSVMLRILLDQHRARVRHKRGGTLLRVSLTDALKEHQADASMVVPTFLESLEHLQTLDRRTAEVTKLRLLWGLTVPEIAQTLEISVSTVEREWRFARTWLAARLDSEAQDSAHSPADR